jgi:hypothetical protein
MPQAESERKGVLESAVEPIESAKPQADLGLLDAGNVVAQVATVAVVGRGCEAAFEAALLPGFVLGVATMFVPKFLPKMGEVSRGRLGTLSRGVQAIELVLGAINLTRRPLRASMPRTRSRLNARRS